jgi:catecholate siderophore receptor
MTAQTRRAGRKMRTVLLAGTGLGVLRATTAAHAQETTGPNRPEVLVFGERDAYKLDTSSLGKLSAPLIDIPQSINTISEQILQDRGVTDFNQALKSVPGITIGAGEFRSMGNSPTIRGFAARSDMFLDGIRDYGDYYRDPFDLESIEVLEGPSSILFGRGSTGGVIEQASKLPRLQPLIAGTLTGGTAETRRITLDVNEPLAALGDGAAARLNVMGHEANAPGRDVVASKRWGVAPSLALGLGTPTRLTVSFYHLYNDDIPDYGLPYFGTLPAAVPRDNFYGFKSDYMRTKTDVASLKVEHDFSATFTAQNQVRYARYSRDFRFSEPLIAATIALTTPLSAVRVTRNVNTGNSVDTMLWDQFFGTLRREFGRLENTSVVGVEAGHEQAAPAFDNSTGVPSTPLLTPNEDQPFTATATFPRYKTHLSANSAAPFVIETAKLGPWEATLGLRWDYFDVDYRDYNYSTTSLGLITRTDQIPHTDEELSYRAALGYKAAANGNFYFAFGTSFNPSAEDLSLISSSRSFSLNSSQLDPEKNRSYELGTKWALAQGRLNVSGAIFRLEKENARGGTRRRAAHEYAQARGDLLERP